MVLASGDRHYRCRRSRAPSLETWALLGSRDLFLKTALLTELPAEWAFCAGLLASLMLAIAFAVAHFRSGDAWRTVMFIAYGELLERRPVRNSQFRAACCSQQFDSLSRSSVCCRRHRGKHRDFGRCCRACR